MSEWNDISTPRRFLPSFMWLAAFEAVARKGSVTDAAQELNLTQGAVSRQIQKLEAQIGVHLFERDKKRLQLTVAGAIYADDVRQGINMITNAGIKLHSNPDGGALDLSIIPAFGTYWLAPRLAAFLAECPGIEVSLSTRTRPFGFTKEPFHAAIHFGLDDWLGAQSLRLMDEEAVIVTAPSLLDAGQIDAGEHTAMDIQNLPLLHLESRPQAWRNWFVAQGLNYDALPGMKFDQFTTMIQAAVFGIGAAIVPKYLVKKELADGSLQALHAGQPSYIGSYYLVWPKRNNTYPPLVAFQSWIAKAALSDIGGI
jgi:LysR family glycine cleavage system transcriptional activator